MLFPFLSGKITQKGRGTAWIQPQKDQRIERAGPAVAAAAAAQ